MTTHTEIEEIEENKDSQKNAEDIGTYSSVIDTSNIFADNVVFNANMGHGYAAERANHLIDKFQGKDAYLVGGDNAKYGADRMVNGIEIQTKYCVTGSKCIAECFNNGKLVYLKEDGTPMQIEVPRDKYLEAIKSMEKRIKNGEVPGINDPLKASEIVKRGHVTYKQAYNIAKAGTIESISYDVSNGIILSSKTAGISSVIAFATSIWNKEDINIAFEKSANTGLKVFGSSLTNRVITTQIGKTGVEKSLRPLTDAVVKKMGTKNAAIICKAVSKKNISGIAASNHVSKMLRGNIVAGVVTTSIISSKDVNNLVKGRISKEQLIKNISETSAGIAGGSAGFMYGSAKGAVIGSFIPGVGTAIGAFVGGLIGSSIVGNVSSFATKKIMDVVVEDDAIKITEIFEQQYKLVADDYLLGSYEVEKINLKIKDLNFNNILMSIYAASDRDSFTYEFLEGIVLSVIEERELVKLPEQEDVINAMNDILLIDEKENCILDLVEYVKNNNFQDFNKLINLKKSIFNQSDLFRLFEYSLTENKYEYLNSIIEIGFAINSSQVIKFLLYLVKIDNLNRNQLKYLLDNSIDINIDDRIVYKEILSRKNWNLIHILLEYSINIDDIYSLISKENGEILYTFLDVLDVNYKFNNTTLLSTYINSKSIKEIILLLKNGAQIKDNNIIKLYSYNNTELRLLLDGDIPTKLESSNGISLLDFFVKKQDWEKVLILLEHKTNYIHDYILEKYLLYIKINKVIFDENLLLQIIKTNNKVNKINARRLSVKNKEIFIILKKEKVIGFYPLGIIPGFRTLILWKMIVASIIYIVIAAFLIDQPSNELIAGIVAIFYPYILITNFLYIRQALPLLKSKRYILSLFLYTFVYFFILGIFIPK